MIKLRTILLCNYPYYIILFIALFYFLITNLFITYKSNYEEIENIDAKIIDNTIKDYGIKLILKNKEKFIGYLYLNKNEQDEFLNNYGYGDIVHINTEKLDINNNTVENTFNYKKYLYNKKIYYTLSVDSYEIIKNNKNILYKIKDKLYKKIINLDNSDYYLAFILGDKTLLSSEIYNSFQSNGISHLLALSGMHINILLLIINMFLKNDIIDPINTTG